MNRLSIRKINESNVLREVFNKAPISRTDVSKTLELTKSTVYSIFTKLENDDLIYDIGQGSSTRSGGRKPALTNFNAQVGYTINTKINQDSVSCMLNWLDGSTISYQEYPLEGQDVSQRLLALYQAIKLSQLDNKDLLGISVSIYGVVRDNHVIKANIAELSEYDLVQILQSRFNVPVLLGNEANMEALFIRDFTQAQTIKSAVSLSLLDGIGAGIVIDGKLYTGDQGEAGEIGHALYYGLEKPIPIENLCSDLAVMQQLQRVTGTEVDIVNLRKGFDSEDTEVMQVLNTFCNGISMVLQNLIFSFDPEKIVISSEIIRAIPELLDKIMEQVSPFAHKQTPVVLADNPEQVSLLGGCALITRSILGLLKGELVFKNRNVPQIN